MKTILVACLLLGSAHTAWSDVHFYQQDTGWSATFIGRSEAEIRQYLKKVVGDYETKLVKKCTTPGWFADFGEGDGFSGACSHPTRLAAKTAVIKSCKAKPVCLDRMARGGYLVSGYDDRTHNPVENDVAYERSRNGDGPNLVHSGTVTTYDPHHVPRGEVCKFHDEQTRDRTGDAVCEGIFKTQLDRMQSGRGEISHYVWTSDAPRKSPWD